MERIYVKNSGPLNGTVKVSGAKNAALPILAATILGTTETILEGVPDLKDISIMIEVIKSLGVEVEHLGRHTLKINAKNLNAYETSYELMSKMRASSVVMGPLLARMRKVVNPLPGGCNIGARPIDLHLKGFRALGIDILEEPGKITATADKLEGSTIYLDFPSVGATQNIMMAATMADGETIIENAAMEPEIVDLASFLNKMGAKIMGAGTSSIRIKGVDSLKGATHQIIPDRIEAGTFMVAAAMTGGDVLVENCIPSHMKPVIAKLIEAGADAEVNDDSVRVKGNKIINPFDIKTLPYPGFPTDMQAQFMALMTIANGTCVMKETVFENRFMHADELAKMGANINVIDREAIVKGTRNLMGTEVEATDLRAGAALIIAGLVAEGTTSISNIYHIDRGYESIEEKFTALGANITRK